MLVQLVLYYVKSIIDFIIMRLAKYNLDFNSSDSAPVLTEKIDVSPMAASCE